MTKLRVDRDWNDNPPFCLHSPISVLKVASFIEQVDTLHGEEAMCARGNPAMAVLVFTKPI